MHSTLKPRRSGKTTAIAEDISWCCLMDMTPIAVIFCTRQMIDIFKQQCLPKHNITKEELDNIHMFVGADTRASYAGNIHYIMSRIHCINPVRIYIDEVQLMHKDFIKELCSRYDDIIYAYGTGVE